MNIEQIALSAAREIEWPGHSHVTGDHVVEFLRRCLSKMAEQDVGPVGYAVMTPFGNVYKFANTLESAERKREALISKFPNKKQGCISKLYTEAQYLAAQQRTAEACAKAVAAEHLEEPAQTTDDAAYDMAIEHAIAAIRNNWREYL